MAIVRILVLLLSFIAPHAGANEALWDLLRGGGQVVLIRHTLTDPGFGDPQNFRLEDCSTQRNLSEEGREHAKRIGAYKGKGNLVMISHGSVALPLTGVSPQQAEIVVLTPLGGDKFRVAGRIPPP